MVVRRREETEDGTKVKATDAARNILGKVLKMPLMRLDAEIWSEMDKRDGDGARSTSAHRRKRERELKLRPYFAGLRRSTAEKTRLHTRLMV